MQINRTGKLLLAVFAGGGLALVVVGIIVVVTAGVIGAFVAIPLVLVGVIWAAVGLGLGAFGRGQARRARHEQSLARTGLRGKATVLEASSGVEINGMPRMRLLVELEIPGHEPRRASQQILMPLFAARRMQAGLVLPAYANPRDVDDFVLVW